MLAVERGGRLYAVHGGATLSNAGTIGATVRVNTVHQVGAEHRTYIEKARIAASAALILALPACSAETAGTQQPLRGVLTAPTDIDLDWTDRGPGVAGHVLEFATEEAGHYTVLDHLPRQVSRYRHPDLMPHTTFFYRLRAYRGPVSRPDRADLPDGIRLTWADHSSHEHGFLLEMRKENGTGYEPVAVVDPDVTVTTLVTLPGEKRATFRVRAYVLGEQSNVVRLTTGE